VAVRVRPGVFSEVFAGIDAQAKIKGSRLLTMLALAVEKQAKINASVGSHPYGTPTPASPGTGPAVISGTLRRALTHEPVRTLGPGHWRTRVGTGVGFSPPYGGRKRAPANLYGYYLETGLRNGATFPFLKPAFDHVRTTGARVIYEAIYGNASWKKIF
jgi:hypothetical protein